MRTRKKTRRTRGQWSTDNADGGGHDPDIGLGGDLDDASGNGPGDGDGYDHDDADGDDHVDGNDRDDAVGDDHVDGNDRDHDIDVFRSVLTPQPRAACSRSARVARRLDWKGNP